MKLIAALGSALVFVTGFAPEAEAAWANAFAIADELGDTDFQLRALYGLFSVSHHKGHVSVALRFSQRFVQIAASSSVQADVLLGERMMGYARHILGEQEEARRLLEHMLAHYEPHPSDVARFVLDHRTVARSQLSLILWLQGFPDQAMRAVETYIRSAMDRGFSRSLIYALAQSACPVALLNGDLASMKRFFALLLDQLARYEDSIWWTSSARFYNAVVLIRQGEFFDGANMLGRAADEPPPNTYHMFYVPLLSELADAASTNEQVERALTTMDWAIERSRRIEELWCMPELLRVRGEIALKAGAPNDAEDYFRQSIDWARRQKALSWELRGATSLARLWQEQGRSGAAYSLLAPVYGRFTEGFATSDLRTAKTLLAAVRMHSNESIGHMSET